MSLRRTSLAAVGFGVLALAGCDSQPTDGQSYEEVTSALATDFGAATPSVLPLQTSTEVNGGNVHSVSMRLAHAPSGSGASVDQVVNYERNLESSSLVVTWSHDGLDENAHTAFRPARFWNALLNTPTFTNIHAADYTGSILDSDLGLNVFPGQGASTHPLGPPVVRKLASSLSDIAAFALFSDNTLRQSYFPSGFWNDFPINNTTAGPTPTTAPLAIQRSADTESIWYGCGFAALFCEIRLSPPNGTNSYVTSNGIGTATVNFGTGAFANNTRPTAIANVSGDGSRWVFAVVDSGSTRSLIAKKDTNALTAAAPNYSQTVPIASGTTTGVTFSSPMPYINSDNKIAVVYFRTDAGGTTRVYEHLWNGSAFVASSSCNSLSGGQIHDTGVVMGTASGPIEPVPSVAKSVAAGTAGPPQNSILYRLPTSDGGYQDTVELRGKKIGTSWCYTKASVPATTDVSGLYIATASDSKLYQVDTGTAASTALSNTWTSVTSFTSDRLGLGYMVQNNGLWEINLQDGTRRQLAPVTGWTGATRLAFGLEVATGSPTLWAFQGSALYKVDLAAGTRAKLSSASCPAWTAVTAMAYLDYNGTADRLFAVNNGSLWRINSDTGACTALGTTGEWTFTNAMAGDPNTNMLYIDRGANATNAHHINVVFPNTGVSLQQTSSISAVTAMTALNGFIYAIKANILYRMTPSTLNLHALSGSVWGGTVFMAPRTWQSTKPGFRVDGCDRAAALTGNDICYGENRLSNPSNLEIPPWTPYHTTVVTAATTAPDGTVTGELLRDDSTHHTHAIYQDNIITSSTATYDWTVYVKMKASNRTGVLLELGSSADPSSAVDLIADLSTGTLFSGTAVGTAAYVGGSIQAVSNGWYKIILTGVPTSMSTDAIYAQIDILPTASSSPVYTGDNASGLYIWGSSLARD